jgi:Protein of unknown function (DUF2795)
MTESNELRAELEKLITLELYPTTGADLPATAAGNHAPDEVQDALRRLPPGTAFGTEEEVWQALGLA